MTVASSSRYLVVSRVILEVACGTPVDFQRDQVANFAVSVVRLVHMSVNHRKNGRVVFDKEISMTNDWSLDGRGGLRRNQSDPPRSEYPTWMNAQGANEATGEFGDLWPQRSFSNGEDGIIAEVLRRISETHELSRWCVEFGRGMECTSPIPAV